jgi:hypothetical protein
VCCESVFREFYAPVGHEVVSGAEDGREPHGPVHRDLATRVVESTRQHHA